MENSRPAESSSPEPAIICSRCCSSASVDASGGPRTFSPPASRSTVGAVPLKKMSSMSSLASSGSNGPYPPSAASTEATSASSSASDSTVSPIWARCETQDSSSSVTRASVRSRLPSGSRPAYRAPSADSRAETRCCTSDTAEVKPACPTNGSSPAVLSSGAVPATQDRARFVAGGRPAAGCPKSGISAGSCPREWVRSLMTPPAPLRPAQGSPRPRPGH